MYKPQTKSAVSILNDQSELNREIIRKKDKIQIQNAERLIDLQCEIASFFMPWWSSGVMPLRKGQPELNQLLLAAFHKNIINIYASLNQTISGLYGPARPLLRNIFEWLMISKFSNISDDISVMKKWHSHETIYFTNGVLKKIEIPDPKPFFDFWAIICEFSHASRSAVQVEIGINSENSYKNISTNLVLISTLLECNYHLLNTHLVTPECEYMGKFYCNVHRTPKHTYNVSELRNESHQIFKSNRLCFGKESKALIASYKRNWKLK